MDTIAVERAGAPSPGMRALFWAEMIASPIVAVAAFFVFVTLSSSSPGVLAILPAAIWVAMLIQCIVTFGRRGWWFLAGLVVGAIAIAILGVVALSGLQGLRID